MKEVEEEIVMDNVRGPDWFYLNKWEFLSKYPWKQWKERSSFKHGRQPVVLTFHHGDIWCPELHIMNVF